MVASPGSIGVREDPGTLALRQLPFGLYHRSFQIWSAQGRG